MSEGTPAPGYYPDPTGAPVLRYWDGRTWTPQTAPLATPPAPRAPDAGNGQSAPGLSAPIQHTWQSPAAAGGAPHTPSPSAQLPHGAGHGQAPPAAAQPTRHPGQSPAGAGGAPSAHSPSAQRPHGTAATGVRAPQPSFAPITAPPGLNAGGAGSPRQPVPSPAHFPMVGLVNAPAPTRGPRAFTGGTWAVLVATIAMVIGALAAAPLVAAAQRPATPTPDAVLTAFLNGVTTADADMWRPTLAPALGRQVELGGGIPLLGDKTLIDELDLQLTYGIGPRHFVRGSTIEFDMIAESDEVPEDRADTAMYLVHLTYSFRGGGSPQEVRQAVRVILSRAFYYDEEMKVPESARAEGNPTAIAPWAVSDIQVPDRYEAATSTTLTYVKPVLDDDGEWLCGSGPEVVEQLSDFARTEGAISRTCILERAEKEDVLGDVDAAALSAGFPIVRSEAPLPELMHLPGADAPLRAYRIDTTEGPFVIFIAQLGDPETHDTNVSIRAAVISIRPMGQNQ